MKEEISKYSSDFPSEFANWLDSEDIQYERSSNLGYQTFDLLEKPDLKVSCITLNQAASESHLLQVDQSHTVPVCDNYAVRLWEDIWRRKTEIVKSSIRAQLGRSIRIAGRLTRIARIDKPTADEFLEKNHLNGTTSARYRFGLFLPKKYFNRLPSHFTYPEGSEQLLVAVATFAAPRIFDKGGTPYKSGELIRLASLLHTTIIGGLSKLVGHFAEKYETDDVMTYVDRDWSPVASFSKSGFELAGSKPPAEFAIDRISFERYPLHRIDNKILYALADRLVRIQNGGSFKYVARYKKTTETPAFVPRSFQRNACFLPYDIIFVVGPTASGKTALSVRIAYEIGAEIISLDSRQIYKGMDIGTGKDLFEYRIDGKDIPYHLIDYLEPGTRYSVHRFVEDFSGVYESLRSRKMPIVACGGSGLYIEAVLNRLATPGPDKALPSVLIIGLNPDVSVRRDRIDKRLKKRLEDGLVEEVKGLIEQGVSESDLIHYGLEYKYVTFFLQNKISYEAMLASLGNEIRRFSKRQVTFLKKIEKSGHLIHWLQRP